jgi:hypothetical protein
MKGITVSENTINIFELAARQKLRFDTPVHSNLSVEQLWDLPLQTTRGSQSDLDGAGKVLLKALREQTEESLVTPSNNAARTELELKLAIVKHIIDVKQGENAAKAAKQAAAGEAQQLESLLQTKKAAELQNLPTEEIEARLAAARARAQA